MTLISGRANDSVRNVELTPPKIERVGSVGVTRDGEKKTGKLRDKVFILR